MKHSFEKFRWISGCSKVVILLIVLSMGTLINTNLDAQSQDCEIGGDVSISQVVSGEGVVVDGGNIFYIPGGKVTITLTFTKSSVTIYALGLESWVPRGWKFLSLVPGSYNPSVCPQSGEVSDGVSPFEFAWITTTNLPEEFSFSYEVEVPGSENSSGVSIVSQGLYRLTGGQLCTNTTKTVFVGAFSGGDGVFDGEGDSDGEVEGVNGDEEGSVENEGSLDGEGGVEGEIGEGEATTEGEGAPDTLCGRIYVYFQCSSKKGDYNGGLLAPLVDILVLLMVVTLLTSTKNLS